ncbi:MAG: VCBS repeat-containing protein [Acidobacteriota bacterium]
MKKPVPTLAIAILSLWSTGASAQVDFVVGNGPGPTNTNRVRVFTSAGTPSTTDFLAYASGTYGVFASAGELNSALFEEILTGPGPGPALGCQVRGFLRDGTAMGKINFFAYGTTKYGVIVAGGNVDSDSFDEILTGPGAVPTFGPQLRAWNFDNVSVAAILAVNVYAFTGVQWGCVVSAGDIDGDGIEEMLTGPGAGANVSPQLRAWNYDGGTFSAITKVDRLIFPGPLYGLHVAAGDVDGDSFDEIEADTGPGAVLPPTVNGLNYDGSVLAPLAGFIQNGGGIGAGDVGGSANDDLMVGQGIVTGANSTVRAYSYNGANLILLVSFTAFPGNTDYGVTVSGGNLGF